MTIVGIILVVLGLLLHIGWLVTLGVILAIIGLVLWVLGTSGRAVGGRNHWY
jgi:hypothetical protein